MLWALLMIEITMGCVALEALNSLECGVISKYPLHKHVNLKCIAKQEWC